jgi:hypothetical protein
MDQIATFAGEIEIDDRDLDANGMPTFWINDEQIKSIKAYWDAASGLRNRDHSVVAVAARTYSDNVYVVACEALPPVNFERDETFAKQPRC